MTANAKLRDDAITHAVYLRGYSTRAAIDAVNLLEETEADLLAQILRLDKKLTKSPLTTKRLEVLLKQVKQVNELAYQALYAHFQEQGMILAAHEASVVAQSITAVTTMKLSSKKVAEKLGFVVLDELANGAVLAAYRTKLASPATVFAAVTARPFEGKLLKDWVDGMERMRLERLSAAIRMGVVEGQTIDDIVKRIRGTKALNYTDGVLETSRRSAAAIAKTYVQHVSNAAHQKVYDDNSEIVHKVQWVSTLDGKTSSICQSRDGNVYPLDSGPRPPAHINCRSTTVAVLKTWREMGINMDEMPVGSRASMDGQVSAALTYQEWLSGKSAKFQNHVLGKGKAELFRSGMTLDKFVDLQGHELTLEELMAK